MRKLAALLAFQDRDDALAPGRTDRDEAAPAAVLVQRLGERRDDATARGPERVAGGERRAVDVELRGGDRAERSVQAQPPAAEVLVLPRRQRDPHGAGERLMDLDEVEV